MIYKLTDNRISINDYFFEMDTENNIHIYSKGMKYLDVIKLDYCVNFEKFKDICNEWLVKNS